MAEWVDVGPVDSMPAGSYRVVDVDDTRVAVFRVTDDEFHAIEDVCTHDGGELTGGAYRDGVVICPRHGAQFSVRTGEALTPPAYEPTETYAVRVRDGVVQVAAEPE